MRNPAAPAHYVNTQARLNRTGCDPPQIAGSAQIGLAGGSLRVLLVSESATRQKLEEPGSPSTNQTGALMPDSQQTGCIPAVDQMLRRARDQTAQPLDSANLDGAGREMVTDERAPHQIRRGERAGSASHHRHIGIPPTPTFAPPSRGLFDSTEATNRRARPVPPRRGTTDACRQINVHQQNTSKHLQADLSPHDRVSHPSRQLGDRVFSPKAACYTTSRADAEVRLERLSLMVGKLLGWDLLRKSSFFTTGQLVTDREDS